MALVVLASVWGAGCSSMPSVFRPFSSSNGEYHYQVEISGVGGRLEDRLAEASILLTKMDEPPASLQALRHRARSDRDVFLRVLRSRGYYDGTVTWSIDTAVEPVVVKMEVSRETRTILERLRIEGLPEDASELSTAAGLESLGVVEGGPALAEKVIGVEQGLLVVLPALGYPFAEIGAREARLDRRAHTMDVLVRVDAGPRTSFGAVHVEGLQTVEESFVRQRVTFEQGEVFSPKQVEDTRKALFVSGVFSAVSITWGERAGVAPSGQAPIRIVVVEGDMHGLGAGVKYSTAEGAGGRTFWEHRNLTGVADRFRVEVEGSQQLVEGAVSYRRPDWFSRGQSLLLDFVADADKPIAYDLFGLMASAGVERPFTKRLIGTAGLAVGQSRANPSAFGGGTSTYTLIGVPLGLRYDGSDNPLNPTSGHRTSLVLTPWASVAGDTMQMLSTRLLESFYVPLTKSGRHVWATRVGIGSVVGPSASQIPADKLLYAGGADSVRGYQFQMAGPIVDVDPDSPDPTGKPQFRPIGGRSLASLGTEIRWRIGENFGLVPFLEGAGVYQSSYPDFSENFQWAAGLGMRYFTVAGPIRLDLGFPINGRQPDSIFQVYISLGQAF